MESLSHSGPNCLKGVWVFVFFFFLLKEKTVQLLFGGWKTHLWDMQRSIYFSLPWISDYSVLLDDSSSNSGGGKNPVHFFLATIQFFQYWAGFPLVFKIPFRPGRKSGIPMSNEKVFIATANIHLWPQGKQGSHFIENQTMLLHGWFYRLCWKKLKCSWVVCDTTCCGNSGTVLFEPCHQIKP